MSQLKTPNKSRTDVQYQEIKLYIEGVQVPFISISVTSALGQLPEAFVAVPPQVGLMEITRFYSPKVHIFFTDPVDGQEKILFSGIVKSPTMNKSANGQASITFTCGHRYQPLTDLLVDYSGWTSDTTNYNPNEAPVKSMAPSSDYGIALALTGIFRESKFKGDKKEVNLVNVVEDRTNNTEIASPAILPASLTDYKNRIIGIPGILINIWNQLKRGAYFIPETNDIMIKMYIPLVEDGLQFFQRMSGHFYIEDKIEAERIDPCPDKPGASLADKPRIVPPMMKTFLRSSIEAEMGVKLLKSQIEFSGELTDLLSIYTKFLSTIDYELLFLTSPAEVLKDPEIDSAGYIKSKNKETYAVDVIVKPQLPFYFAPKCNVLYPNMVNGLSVMQDDYNVPTRVTLRNDEIVESGGRISTYYRGPASIREAIATFAGVSPKGTKIDTTTASLIRTGTRDTVQTNINTKTGEVPTQNLKATLGSSHSKVGKYEQGRGLKSEKMLMPNWLRYFSHTQFRDPSGQNTSTATINTTNNEALEQLARGWEKRYGAQKAALNPWHKDSELKAYQKLLVSTVDYYYAMSMARSRQGSVESIFNPYIVVGYPMDILDGTPNHPSFHAYCTSVTHNITESSIGTSISFVSALTYTELANYYLPGAHPWLQYVLGLAESQSIVNYVPAAGEEANTTASAFGENGVITSPDAKGVANGFYFTTLGVAAVAPTEVYDFDTGNVKPLSALGPGVLPGNTNSRRGLNGGEENPMLSGSGNLELAYRNIESKTSVQNRWGIKFIDFKAGNYNTSVIRIRNQKLAEKDALEPGQSQWLDYEPPYADPVPVTTVASKTVVGLEEDEFGVNQQGRNTLGEG